MKLQRTIEQWKGCNPAVMASEMSEAAIMHAINDAKHDIASLHEENAILKRIAQAIAYPKRGTTEESMTIESASTLILEKFSLEDLAQ